MKSIRTILMALGTIIALGMGPGRALQAQSSPDDAATRTLREMVAEPTPDVRNREVIDQFLSREDVRDVARSHGMDPDRLSSTAATLDAETAGNLATRISTLQDEGVLAGGDTFVISATTVIIILLLLILIAVA